ncbi:adenylate/guanylate cyclase domain-containing protein [Breoghania sp. L-A4]|uniref:adenylate/guanylate cyclase domain-containing protein n=1 Tax=Breoghania sp. L-A4 TaxID=2304600 RepID=UPI0013C355CB|nr:adenylate/guanylate cyclase domain-containing protein [Breoghania sp. L-A4]
MAAPLLHDIETWLIRDARLLDSPQAIVSDLCERLIKAGIPLIRLRIGQRVSSPLHVAWGIVWHLGKVESFSIERSVLKTDSFIGSPFHVVTVSHGPYRRTLDTLTNDDHETLFEMRALGGADYLAVPLEYGDGTIQVAAFVMDALLDGAQLDAMTSLRHAIAAALEPTAMRYNTRSILSTYLGREPAERILSGAIQRGDTVHIDAVVLFTDLRGFTELADTLPEATLLDMLDTYFEAVVSAVHAHGGEVLKFLGDGVLAIFPITEDVTARAACEAAVAAIRLADETLRSECARAAAGVLAGALPNCFAAALHIGPVVYGNVGSRERLDFTVVGTTVNLVSRLELLAKGMPQWIVCSSAFNEAWGGKTRSLGEVSLKGLSGLHIAHVIDRGHTQAELEAPQIRMRSSSM